jgi:hypothetical protein
VSWRWCRVDAAFSPRSRNLVGKAAMAVRANGRQVPYLPPLLLTDPREFDILQSGLAGERTECDSFGRDVTAQRLTVWARLSGSTI